MYTFKSVINSLFEENINPKQARVLFLGDSNTFDNPANWTGYLINDLGMKYTKIIQKNGSTTQWMKEQLANDLSKGNKYDYVFIWGGVNDIYSTGTQSGKNKAIQNIKDMIMMVRRAKTIEGKTPKIVVINMACDKLRDDTLRYAVNEKLADEFYKDVLNIQYAQVIPTREVLKMGNASCEKLSAQQIMAERSLVCRDKLCHLKPQTNKVLADYIKRNVFKV